MAAETVVCSRCRIVCDKRLIVPLGGWCTDCVIIWAQLTRFAQTGQIKSAPAAELDDAPSKED